MAAIVGQRHEFEPLLRCQITKQPGVTADPELAVAVDQQFIDGLPPQTVGRFAEQAELAAVVAGQAIPRSHPQITGAILGHRHDGALAQAFGHAELAKAQRRRSCGQGRCNRQPATQPHQRQHNLQGKTHDPVPVTETRPPSITAEWRGRCEPALPSAAGGRKSVQYGSLRAGCPALCMS